MANKTLTEKQFEEFTNEPIIDLETIERMEAGASSNDRGIERRITLATMTNHIDTLAKISSEKPEEFNLLYETVESFKKHAQSLLDVAELASARMQIADQRKAQH